MDPSSTPEAILCVDDEGIILMHLVMILKRKYGDRYRYERASNAEEGLAVVERLESEGIRVGILITDWIMPGASGDEFVRALRAARPELRAIVVSGKTDEAEIRKLGAEAGLAGFLSKPIVSEELFALIDRVEEDRRSGT